MTFIDGGAWGAGLATVAGDRVLEVFYPDPRLGEPPSGQCERDLSAGEAERYGIPRVRTDDRLNVRQTPVLTVIGDLGEPPASTADAYLRLHLLSHRLIKP